MMLVGHACCYRKVVMTTGRASPRVLLQLMECWVRHFVMRPKSLGCVLKQFCFCLGQGGPTMCVGTFVMITNSIKSGGYPRMSLFRFGVLHSLGNFACVFAWGYKLTIGSPMCIDIVFALRLLFVFD